MKTKKWAYVEVRTIDGQEWVSFHHVIVDAITYDEAEKRGFGAMRAAELASATSKEKREHFTGKMNNFYIFQVN